MTFLAGQRVTGAAISLATDPPVFSGYQSTVQSIPNNSFTAVTIDTEVIDTVGGHSTITNSSRYVCQVAGLYLLTGCVVFGTTGSGVRGSAFGFNGADSARIIGSEQLTAVSPVATTSVPTPTYQRLVVGDFVSLLAFQNTGSALNTASVGAAMTSFNVHRISN